MFFFVCFFLHKMNIGDLLVINVVLLLFFIIINNKSLKKFVLKFHFSHSFFISNHIFPVCNFDETMIIAFITASICVDGGRVLC